MAVLTHDARGARLPRRRDRRPGTWSWGALLAACLAWAIVPTVHALDADSLETLVKATYLYKFAPYVTWPEKVFAAPDSPLVICVVGDDAFGAVMDRAVRGQSFGTRGISVLSWQTVSAEGGCHILFLAAAEPRRAAEQLASIADKPVLTVTDAKVEPAAKGMINFVVVENRVHFEVDAGAVARSGLTISSKLLSLAISVKARS